MGWMRRYGVFERHEGGLWRLTRAGERVLLARKQAAALESVADVPDGALVDVMAHVTSRYRRGDPLMATLLRREFEFGTRPGSVAYQQSRRRRRR
jgi:hypothetical protein